MVAEIADLDRETRERRLLDEICRGNVPEFLRRLVAVTNRAEIVGTHRTASFFVTPDYLAVGSDEDYFLTPLSPAAAWEVARAAGCCLPTPLLVDLVWSNAAMRLEPQPIPPSAGMTSVAVFRAHNDMVRAQRRAGIEARPLGVLVAGHKKDVVLSAGLAGRGGRVAIYGWHRANGVPIQPLYVGHAASWVDYSHGIRLVSQRVWVDGRETGIEEILTDPSLSRLVSSEGPLDPQVLCAARPGQTHSPGSASAKGVAKPAETIREFTLEPGVRVRLDLPAVGTSAGSDRLLVLYALPNGNSIEETAGRQPRTAREWRFGIQHIAAQTRWLRAQRTNTWLAVAYLEAEGRSWPAWRKRYGDRSIPGVIAGVRAEAELPVESAPRTGEEGLARGEVEGCSRVGAPRGMRLALVGHSGGGSLLLGCVEAFEAVPTGVERLAFLDANYAYDTAKHRAKLLAWLRESARHWLCVVAYDDANALLDGRSFVSAAGGTWGRSQAMLLDMGAELGLEATVDGLWRRHRSSGGRVQFVLRENPDRAVLHTVLVERNGFIHALEAGTAGEGVGYEYFGPRVYDAWIEAVESGQ